MHFYRRLNPIKAISFDLDDTLYDNWPIIMKAEQAQFNYLQQHLPQVKNTELKQWQTFRFALAKTKPQLSHDIGLLRRTAIKEQLQQLGVSEQDAQHHSQQAFEVFYQQRIQVTIEPHIISTLKILSEKLPLIAITNGNACIDTMGLGEICQFALLAGHNGHQQKPSRDMFDAASKKLNIPNQNILHIGDSQYSDVQGALNAGCMAAWFNPNQQTIQTRSTLPHLEFQQIKQLLELKTV